MSIPRIPPLDAVARTALNAADLWLTEQTQSQMRSLWLGEERGFDVDQDEASLTLTHADGYRETLRAEIIGSFRPQDRSFRWAWANTSVDRALTTAARAAQSRAVFAALTEPTFETTFETARMLAAYAALTGGLDGVYRGLTDNALTVFVGFRAPQSARPPSPNEAAATKLVDAYDAAMLPLDRAYQAARNRDAAMDSLLKDKNAVYDRFWRRNDDFWRPSSFGWPSEHDNAERLRRFAVPRRAGGLYVVTERRTIGWDALVVTPFDDGLFITDYDLDWGRGVLLGSSASP